MKIIGLTGGIGSGKTTVAQMITKLGYPVVCADKLAHDAISIGSPAYKLVIERFGKEILATDKSIDRKKLGEIVFKDDAKRLHLNNIIHPVVIQKLQTSIQQSKNSNKNVLILDVPLLYEEGLDTLCHQVIVVYATEEQMIERVMKRSNLSKDEIQDRIRSQLTIDSKKSRAHYVVHNTGDLAQTESEIQEIFQSIEKSIQ